MLRFLSLLLALSLFSSSAEARRQKELRLEENKAYVFYIKDCPMCQKALNYVNDRYQTRPDVVRLDLSEEESQELLQQCASKFGFKNIVVPVFCVGDKYFMGWSSKASEALNKYITEKDGW